MRRWLLCRIHKSYEWWTCTNREWNWRLRDHWGTCRSERRRHQWDWNQTLSALFCRLRARTFRMLRRFGVSKHDIYLPSCASLSVPPQLHFHPLLWNSTHPAAHFAPLFSPGAHFLSCPARAAFTSSQFYYRIPWNPWLQWSRPRLHFYSTITTYSYCPPSNPRFTVSSLGLSSWLWSIPSYTHSFEPSFHLLFSPRPRFATFWYLSFSCFQGAALFETSNFYAIFEFGPRFHDFCGW